jgi:hypothetical protein
VADSLTEIPPDESADCVTILPTANKSVETNGRRLSSFPE